MAMEPKVSAPSPMTMLIAASANTLVCVVLLVMSLHRVMHLENVDEFSLLHYLQVALFGLGVLFWSWSGWKAWVRHHDAESHPGERR